MRPLFVAVLTLGLLLPALASPVPGASPEPPCAGFQVVEGQGPSCPVPGGWRIFLEDGTTLLTHGPDPPRATPPFSAAAASDPVCVDESSYHGHVVYAHPWNKANRSSTMTSTIRSMIRTANGHLVSEAAETGGYAKYKVLCEPDGQIRVTPVTLGISSSADSFSAIVSDLQTKGFKSTKAKYWVWYDDSVAGAAGQGNIQDDDRLVASNANNVGPSYGLTYGYVDWTVMMHENGHNLGAVQLSAPMTSGGWHCNDGKDIMCYADGGSRSNYRETYCTDREHFDCRHDSYFHTSPTSGYLTTHWNLGNRLNRFFSFAPLMSSLSCVSPAYDAADAQCSFAATSDANVFYNVTWGDGTTSRVPETGSVPPGVVQTAGHQYAAGSYTVTVKATDTGTPAGTSGTLSASLLVHTNTPPTFSSMSCGPSPVFVGATFTCDLVGYDRESGVVYDVDWGDGTTTRTAATASNVTRSATRIYTAPGTYTVVADAEDQGIPLMTTPQRSAVVEARPCSWTRSGTLVAGAFVLPLLPVVNSRFETSLPCAAGSYTLTTTDGIAADFDVCWQNGTTVLRCDGRTGPESGTIPAGSNQARVTLRSGFAGTYRLATV